MLAGVFLIGGANDTERVGDAYHEQNSVQGWFTRFHVGGSQWWEVGASGGYPLRLQDVFLGRVEGAVDATPTAAPTPTPVPLAPSATPEATRRATVAEKAPVPLEPPQDRGVEVWVTFYACEGPHGGYCAHPAGGLPLGEGQAACDRRYLGQQFLLNGGTWLCNDLGSAVRGDHVDLFFEREVDGWAYIRRYGDRGKLTWLE